MVSPVWCTFVFQRPKMLPRAPLTLIIVSGICALAACKHEAEADSVDALLLDLARSEEGATWYKNNTDLLATSGGSGHAQPYLRTRYNALAAAMLDSNAQVSPGITFPAGSVIVKELWDDASTLSLYAVMYKRPGHPYADATDWVWGYVQPDGEAREPSRNAGSACRGCHGGGGNIDLTLMNTSFP